MKKNGFFKLIVSSVCSFWVMFALIYAFIFSVHAKDTEKSALPEMQQTDSMTTESAFMAKALPQIHYLHTPISEIDGKKVVEDFMKSLDYNKMYFLQEDHDLYMRFGPSMQGYITMANNYPAFAIFDDYRKRVLDRIEWALKRLDGNFDFSADRDFLVDRKDVEWPKDKATADKLWEDYLEFQLLNELMSLKFSDKDSNMNDDTSIFGTTTKKKTSEKNEKVKEMTEDEMMTEAKNVVKRRLQRLKKSVMEIEAEDVHEVFLTTIANQYDPHSTFMSSRTMDDFNIQMKNSLIGIGALLEDVDGYCTIKELTPGAPAALSKKLFPGDKILGVREEKDKEYTDVIDMKLNKIVTKIRGKKGTKIYLQIRPADGDPSERREIVLVRDEVKVTQNLASAQYFELPQENGKKLPIGVINLPSFYGSETAGTTRDVKELILKLKKMGIKGLVLDLRTNGGGLLNEAVALTGLFIPQGPVVQVSSSDGNVRVLSDDDKKTVWDGPLIVLTSRWSASASEIVAGALQNYKRALVVGDATTHGKGTVQSIFEVSSFLTLNLFGKQSAAAKITIQKFYLPNGNSTQLKGVASDITLPSINPLLPIGESDLENPLPWDTIAATDFAKKDISKESVVNDELIKKLKLKSEERQSSLEEFTFLKRNIDWFAERQKQKSFSLNMDKRIKQKEEDKAVKKAADEETEKLAKNNFTSEEVLLDVAMQEKAEREAEEAGKQASAKSTDEEKSGEDEEESGKKPELDIHLRESLRVMLDWLAIEPEA